uniref:Uncharacterized protein n=1 Tax=Octopus bimaculoides TaxID=37653 RepID=A0A0L8GWD3_OCTBM
MCDRVSKTNIIILIVLSLLLLLLGKYKLLGIMDTSNILRPMLSINHFFSSCAILCRRVSSSSCCCYYCCLVTGHAKLSKPKNSRERCCLNRKCNLVSDSYPGTVLCL